GSNRPLVHRHCDIRDNSERKIVLSARHNEVLVRPRKPQRGTSGRGWSIEQVVLVSYWTISSARRGKINVLRAKSSPLPPASNRKRRSPRNGKQAWRGTPAARRRGPRGEGNTSGCRFGPPLPEFVPPSSRS